MSVKRRRGLMPVDLLNFHWLQEIALGPKGDYVAYTVKHPGPTGNDYTCDLHIHDLRNGTVETLTPEGGYASSLAWDREGSRLAYSWKKDEYTELHLWKAADRTRTSYPVTGSPFSDLDWSPDGRRLAAVRWTPWLHSQDHCPAPGIPAPSVKVIRRLRYKQDGVGWVHNRYRQIWILDFESGEQVQLTNTERDHGEPCWSWNGRWLAFTSTTREQDKPTGYGQILLYDCEAGTTRPMIPGWQGAALSPQWRRDDQAIAFTGHHDSPPVNRRRFFHIWLYDLQTETAIDLTKVEDQTVGNYAVADQRAGLTTVTLDWPGGVGPVNFLLTEAGATHLCRVTPGEEVDRVTTGEQVTFAYSAAANGAVVYGRADPGNPGDLYLWQRGDVRRLTDLNPWLRDHSLATPKSYFYEGLAGTPVHAWLVHPINFQADQVYPTIVYVHCSMFSWDFNQEVQCLANAGFAVAYFNQRGTTAGYGQEHALGNYYGKHEDEFAEIMLGVDELAQRPYLDSLRMGVTGGSCGGFMTNWIVSHTDRFAAAVTQRSVSDLVSKFGTSDNGPEQAISEGGRAPWENASKLWESSPLAHAGQIRTPLLILHSEEDHRCALSQAEELFSALRWLERKVELVIFSGESHGLSRGGRPGNRIERLERILYWFTRHLSSRELEPSMK